MDFLKIKFTLYSLCYYANDKEKKPGDCIIKISCYGDGKKIKQNYGGTALTIKFFKDDSKIPPNELCKYGQEWAEEFGEVEKINLHYPISQFNDIISILRYEKPPFYLFIEDKDRPKGGLLTKGFIEEYKDKLKDVLSKEGIVEDDNKYRDVPIKFFKQ